MATRSFRRMLTTIRSFANRSAVETRMADELAGSNVRNILGPAATRETRGTRRVHAAARIGESNADPPLSPLGQSCGYASGDPQRNDDPWGSLMAARARHPSSGTGIGLPAGDDPAGHRHPRGRHARKR